MCHCVYVKYIIWPLLWMSKTKKHSSEILCRNLGEWIDQGVFDPIKKDIYWICSWCNNILQFSFPIREKNIIWKQYIFLSRCFKESDCCRSSEVSALDWMQSNRVCSTHYTWASFASDAPPLALHNLLSSHRTGSCQVCPALSVERKLRASRAKVLRLFLKKSFYVW